MTEFKVRINVEVRKDANSEFEEIDLPFRSVITLETRDEAMEFAQHMHGYGELLAAQYVDRRTIDLYRKLAKTISGFIHTKSHSFGNIAYKQVVEQLASIAGADPEK